MGQKFIGIVLPIRMGNTGMFDQSTTAIQQTRSNFKNLILTKKGERLSQPTLGCDIWKILFEPFTDESFENARISVVDAVDTWLPFIELVDFNATKSEAEGIISIKCLYRFRSNPLVTDEVIINTNLFGIPVQNTLADEEQAVENTKTRIRRRDALLR